MENAAGVAPAAPEKATSKKNGLPQLPAEAPRNPPARRDNEEQHYGDENHDPDNAHRDAGNAAKTEYAGSQCYEQQSDDKLNIAALRTASGFRR